MSAWRRVQWACPLLICWIYASPQDACMTNPAVVHNLWFFPGLKKNPKPRHVLPHTLATRDSHQAERGAETRASVGAFLQPADEASSIQQWIKQCCSWKLLFNFKPFSSFVLRYQIQQHWSVFIPDEISVTSVPCSALHAITHGRHQAGLPGWVADISWNPASRPPPSCIADWEAAICAADWRRRLPAHMSARQATLSQRSWTLFRVGLREQLCELHVRQRHCPPRPDALSQYLHLISTSQNNDSFCLILQLLKLTG